MSKKYRLDRKIGFQNTFYTKCINVIIDSIGPSIVLRSVLKLYPRQLNNIIFPKSKRGQTPMLISHTMQEPLYKGNSLAIDC